MRTSEIVLSDLSNLVLAISVILSWQS